MEWVIANMAPLMFCGLVVFLLLGYPVAFALAANGLLFGLLGIATRPARARRCYRHCRNASTASSPTTPCWPSPSSPSWA